MNTPVVCPNGHVTVLHPRQLVAADLPGGWHIITVCPRCMTRTYNDITTQKADELINAGAKVLTLRSLTQFRQARGEAKHGRLTATAVDLWAALLSDEEHPETGDDLIRAWLNAEVTA